MELEILLAKAREIRPEIHSVEFKGTVFADGETFNSYEARDPAERWQADSPEELLKDIKEWS